MIAAIDPDHTPELLFLLIDDAQQMRSNSERWSGAQVLALGAILLPAVEWPVPLPNLDVNEALTAAAVGLTPGRASGQTGIYVATAQAMLRRHLRASYGIADDEQRDTRLTYASWLQWTGTLGIVRELAAAAWFNRLRLLASELGDGGMFAYLAQCPQWSGATDVVSDHPFNLAGRFGSSDNGTAMEVRDGPA